MNAPRSETGSTKRLCLAAVNAAAVFAIVLLYGSLSVPPHDLPIYFLLLACVSTNFRLSGTSAPLRRFAEIAILALIGLEIWSA